MPARAWWGLLLLALLVSSQGAFLNDETDQATALWNLSHGSLWAKEYPGEFYVWGEHALRAPPRYETSEIPIGSTGLNVLALPAAAIVVGLSWIAPVAIVVSVLAAVALWGTAGWPWPWRLPSGRSNGAIAIGLVALVALASDGFQGRFADVHRFYPFIALRATNIALWLAGCWLLWDLLRRHVGDSIATRAAFVAAALGPWLFWGTGLKYHALSATIVTALLWLQAQPRSSRTTLATGLLAGLAFWSHPSTGLVAVTALALCEAPRAWLDRREPRRLLAAWSFLLLGFAVGLVPALAENTIITGHPLQFAILTPHGFATNGTNETLAGNTPLQDVAAHGGFGDWGSKVLDVASILTTGHRVQGRPVGLLFVSPLLAGGVLGISTIWRSKSRPAAFAVAVLGAHALLLGAAAANQGEGRDVRMWVPALSSLALLAAFGLQKLRVEWTRGDGKAVAVACVLAAALALTALILVVRLGFELGSDNRDHVRNFLLLWLSLSVGATLLLAGALPLKVLRPARAAAVGMGLLLSVPTVWGVVYLVGDPQPLYLDNEAYVMLVPGMDHVVTPFADAIVHDPPLPIVYDEHGRLVFHPDYGLCTRDPNPCPTTWPVPDWAQSGEAGNG